MTNSNTPSPNEELSRPVTVETPVPTRNAKLLDWVEEVAALTEPDEVHWCDGSAEEYEELCRALVDAGTITNWRDPQEMKKLLRDRFNGSMKGRTMYVVPFSMAPLDSPHAELGV